MRLYRLTMISLLPSNKTRSLPPCIVRVYCRPKPWSLLPCTVGSLLLLCNAASGEHLALDIQGPNDHERSRGLVFGRGGFNRDGRFYICKEGDKWKSNYKILFIIDSGWRLIFINHSSLTKELINPPATEQSSGLCCKMCLIWYHPIPLLWTLRYRHTIFMVIEPLERTHITAGGDLVLLTRRRHLDLMRALVFGQMVTAHEFLATRTTFKLLFT